MVEIKTILNKEALESLKTELIKAGFTEIPSEGSIKFRDGDVDKAADILQNYGFSVFVNS